MRKKILRDLNDYIKQSYDYYREQEKVRITIDGADTYTTPEFIEYKREENKMEDFKLIFTKTTNVKSPVRGHDTDAGIDFFIPEDFESIVLNPNEDILIDSGIRVVVPKGYALIFKEKSGVAVKRKLTIGAAVVDSDYRGNVHLHLFNNGTTPQRLEPGDKIAQGLVIPVSLCQTEEVSGEVYDEYCNTERGEGGFGSTGDK